MQNSMASEISVSFPDIIKITKNVSYYSINKDGVIDGKYHLSEVKIYRPINEKDLKFDASVRVLELCIDDIQNSKPLEKSKPPEDPKSEIRTSGSKRKREEGILSTIDQKSETVTSTRELPQRKRKRTERYDGFVYDDNLRNIVANDGYDYSNSSDEDYVPSSKWNSESMASWRTIVSEFKNVFETDITYDYYGTESNKKCRLSFYNGKSYITFAELKSFANCKLTLEMIFSKYTKEELLSKDSLIKCIKRKSSNDNRILFGPILVSIDILEKCITKNEVAAKMIKDMTKKYTLSIDG